MVRGAKARVVAQPLEPPGAGQKKPAEPKKPRAARLAPMSGEEEAPAPEEPAPAPQGEMKVAHTYMGAGPTVESAASLAHTGQVVRIKTKGQTFFLECDAADTPTMLIKRLEKLGHVSPQPLSLHFGALHSSTSTRPLRCARARLLGSGRSGSATAPGSAQTAGVLTFGSCVPQTKSRSR